MGVDESDESDDSVDPIPIGIHSVGILGVCRDNDDDVDDDDDGDDEVLSARWAAL